ncbi:MAG: isochorismatase family cysteine hydrolase [archaeon]
MKIIFWNVDTQYDFMRNDKSFSGKLPISGARAIEGNLEKLTRFAKDKNIKVVNTGDWHTACSKEIAEKPDFKTTFPAHCVIGTKGAEFIPATNPQEPYIVDWQMKNIDNKEIAERRNITIYKDDFDVFKGNRYTEQIVDKIKPQRAVVYGVATNVCVNFAVLGLLQKNIEVVVAEDAIKELPGPFAELIDNWKNNGALVKKTEEILGELR